MCRRVARRRGGRLRREGAAMLVAMLVMLSVGTLAVFAAHATAFELRASGYVRRAVQVQYVAESGLLASMAWMDRVGPPAFLRAMRRTVEDNRGRGEPALALEPFGEPPLAEGKEGYRLFPEDLYVAPGTPVVDRESIGGSRQAFDPRVFVDVVDVYEWQRPVAGERADGQGQLRFLRATYTARGQVRVATGGGQVWTTNDARALGLSGPFGG